MARGSAEIQMGSTIERGVAEANNEKQLSLQEWFITALPQTTNKIKTEYKIAIPKKQPNTEGVWVVGLQDHSGYFCGSVFTYFLALTNQIASLLRGQFIMHMTNGHCKAARLIFLQIKEKISLQIKEKIMDETAVYFQFTLYRKTLTFGEKVILNY